MAKMKVPRSKKLIVLELQAHNLDAGACRAFMSDHGKQVWVYQPNILKLGLTIGGNIDAKVQYSRLGFISVRAEDKRVNKDCGAGVCYSLEVASPILLLQK